MKNRTFILASLILGTLSISVVYILMEIVFWLILNL